MSLAEDLPRSYIGSLSRHAPQKLARMSLAELAGKSVPEPTIPRKSTSDMLPNGAPEPVAKEPTSVVSLAKRHDRPEKAKESESSLELLDRASKGMSFILNRYKQLEDHIKQVDSWSNAQIQAAESAAAQWQEAATLAEKRLEDCQRSLDIMVRRAEAAEQCMHRDKEALTVLQDRIIQAFGFGSDAHEALNATMNLT
jgi:uncharacterized phage infection (PIP) family protein YhgE